jgi:DNA-binding MarR family transcriptional regulator
MLQEMSSAATKPDPIAAWHEMNRLHATIHTALDRELRAEHALSAVEYEVLAKLSSCESGKARVSELADLLRLNQSTASRVIGRLEEDGLAARAMCADDRRGIFATVTPAGRDKAAAAEPTYRSVLESKLQPLGD